VCSWCALLYYYYMCFVLSVCVCVVILWFCISVCMCVGVRSPTMVHGQMVWVCLKPTPCQAFLQKKHSRILSSQIVEDAFGRQKRRKAVAITRRLDVASAWDVLQTRHLVDQVHRYATPEIHVGPPARSDFIPDGTFKGPLSCKSLDVTGISSYTQKPSWYTCKPECHAVQFLDTKLLAYCEKKEMKARMKSPWLNVMVQAKHHIILREVLGQGEFGPPLFACTFVKGSMAFGWPAVACPVPGHPREECYIPARGVDESMVPLVVLDCRHWQALSFEWRSPSWQHAHRPGTRGRWAQHIRAFPCADQAEFRPLLKAATMAGFWGLSADVVRKVASNYGIDMPEGASLFGTCKAAVIGILKCSELEACGILHVFRTDPWDNTESPTYIKFVLVLVGLMPAGITNLGQTRPADTLPRQGQGAIASQLGR
jgi:hypothetical protein